MLGKIVISVNKNYYFLEINGFSRKTADSTVILDILNKNYGPLINYKKSGNDLVLNFERIVIVIKSIRNINKLGNDDTLFNYVASFKDETLMRLVKIKQKN